MKQLWLMIGIRTNTLLLTKQELGSGELDLSAIAHRFIYCLFVCCFVFPGESNPSLDKISSDLTSVILNESQLINPSTVKLILTVSQQNKSIKQSAVLGIVLYSCVWDLGKLFTGGQGRGMTRPIDTGA